LPEVGAVVIAGGGGNPLGLDGGKAKGVLPAEALPPEKAVKPDTPPLNPSEKLQAVAPQPTKLDLVDNKDGERFIDPSASVAATSALENLGQKARQQIAGLIAAKGQGGTGEGGGQGKGSGTGTGDLSGPGQGRMSQREKRQLRWTMIFNTRDGGEDYLRQLRALGAILAIPQDDGQFLVIRDLGKRPAAGQIEDISQINRIYWVDDKPHSVQPLAFALGLQQRPRVIAAFFPEKLEKELLEKEARRFRGPEDEIHETKFQVMARRGSYEPEVIEVLDKRGRRH
jgi:hypothetical protein